MYAWVPTALDHVLPRRDREYAVAGQVRDAYLTLQVAGLPQGET